MWGIIKAGGPVMWPLLVLSVVSLAIIVERLYSLQEKRILPADLTDKMWKLVETNQLTERHVLALANNSALGQILAAGLSQRYRPREYIKEAIEDTGRHVVHELERFLNLLGSIASVSPLLGLLGTVIGIITAFSSITQQGVGDPKVLSGGIGQALIATATGLVVAIPSLMAYRYLRGHVEGLVIKMEKEALRLVQALDAHRGVESGSFVATTNAPPQTRPARSS
jgi:biopolymer transport protein ExbB